jgi:hypothetical protein
MSRAEIERALYGRHKGGRIRVAPPEERTADGIVFDSKREMHVYLQLKTLERAGTIRDLKLQVRFPLHVNGQKVCEYITDFTFLDLTGKLNVFDAKGHITEMYALKRKMFHAEYTELRITEV